MIKVWIGNRESEILSYDFFDASITFYGSNSGSNIAFSKSKRIKSNYKVEFFDFVVKNIFKYLDKDADAEFHFYNPTFACRILSSYPNLRTNFCNINSAEVLKWLNSKTFVREWMSNDVDVPAYTVLSAQESTVSNLDVIFSGSQEYILQKDVSAGGEGTYLITRDSESEVLSILSQSALYLVSPFFKSKRSVCCHMLIGEDDIAVFPFGEQISQVHGNRLLYEGTSYKNIIIDANEQNQLIEMSIKVGKKIQKIGYRGICGLDFILHNHHVYFIEINARYLGSTFIINKRLSEISFPSVFELNTMCFRGQTLPVNEILSLSIGYSSRVVVSKGHLNSAQANVLILKARETAIELYEDGITDALDIENDTYLFRYIL